ncbi:MAG: 50S ribosomal protein L19 [Planctomycetota bacterium]
MSDAILADIQQSQMKADLPRIDVGDTVDVHVRIIEGSKERIQVFTGVVIADQNGGLERTICVRRIVANEGVERTFPVHSPRIAKIEVKRHGDTRRAKLYFLRDRVGKKRRLRDRRRGIGYLDSAASELLEAKSRQRKAAKAAAGKD